MPIISQEDFDILQKAKSLKEKQIANARKTNELYTPEKRSIAMKKAARKAWQTKRKNNL